MKCLVSHVLATLTFAAVFAAFAGCATARFSAARAQPATVEQLRRMAHVGSPFDCLLYEGSDARFHYLHHHLMGGGASHRIPRNEWKPDKEFPLGQKQAQVIHPFPAAAP